MDRRALLRGMAAAGSTGLLGSLAGCTYGNDGSAGGALGTPDGTATTAGATTARATTAEATTMAENATESGATVAVASTDEFGGILVDAAGMTLYLFTKDEGSESVCYGDCEANWPPLVVDGEPVAGDGVSAELGTTERRDGSAQVTAAGRPLYYFAGDGEPGDTNGQGLGDAWYVVSPSGERIDGREETETETGTGTSDPYY